jgi:DNA-directed RNA polymerase subunit RPC12/RpoP
VFDAEVMVADDIHELKGEIVGSGAVAIIPDTKDIMTFKCSACGAEIVIDTAEATSGRCHWCRHVLSVNEQIPNGAVPDMVLPFKMDRAVAEGKIREFVKRRQFFAHPRFRREFTTENIMGVYLPYMVVDVNGHAKFVGQGEHLVRQYTKGLGDNKKTYYDADLYDVGREFDILIDDLTVESSMDKLNQDARANTNNIINAIMPFDTENCVRWNANYLRGYASEKRDTDTAELKPVVVLQAKDVARYKAGESLAFYDRGVRWQDEAMDVAGVSWRAAYLPVWLYSYYQEEKKLLHYCAVNARTGETMGSVPVNKGRLLAMAFVVEVVGILLGTGWILAFLQVDTDGDNPAMFGLLGYTPGFIFYWVMWMKYRNTNARHYHEKETKATVENLKQRDDFVEHRVKLRNAVMDGANNGAVRGSRNSVGSGVGKSGEAAMRFVREMGLGKFIPKG